MSKSSPNVAHNAVPVAKHFVLRAGRFYLGKPPALMVTLPGLALNFCDLSDAQKHAADLNEAGDPRRIWHVEALELKSLEVAA